MNIRPSLKKSGHMVPLLRCFGGLLLILVATSSGVALPAFPGALGFGGTASGRGATYAWESDKVSHGKMEILETTPALVKIKLDFLKPMEAQNTAEFTLTPQGDATHVTWAMSGDAPYLSKLMQVFVSMDKMVGKDFEAGLANMRASAEK